MLDNEQLSLLVAGFEPSFPRWKAVSKASVVKAEGSETRLCLCEILGPAAI
jgi:hypothetical protein